MMPISTKMWFNEGGPMVRDGVLPCWAGTRCGPFCLSWGGPRGPGGNLDVSFGSWSLSQLLYRVHVDFGCHLASHLGGQIFTCMSQKFSKRTS